MKTIKQEYLDEVILYVWNHIEDVIIKLLKKTWYNVDEYDIKVSLKEEDKKKLERILNKIKQEWYLEWKFNI